MKIPTFLTVVVVSTAMQACEEHCFHTATSTGQQTETTCADDAGCFTYRDDAGQPLFTDCPVADACVSIRTYPDGAQGPGGDYC